MNKNRLKKTASILLAGIMSFGVFAFAGPVFNVNADEEYSFKNIGEWPEEGPYKCAEIDGVKWVALDYICWGDFKGELPTPNDTCNNYDHFVLYGEEKDLALDKVLSLSGEDKDVTLNLNGYNIVATNKLMNLSDDAHYSIIDTTGTGSIKKAGGYSCTTEGGFFSVESGAQLRIQDISINGQKPTADLYDINAKGGAIYVGPGGAVNLSGVNITKCNAYKGSAVYVSGGGRAVLTDVDFNSNGNLNLTQEGAAVYCEANGTAVLTGSISASNNIASSKGDIWFVTSSHIQIGSTSNSFSLGCSDYTDPHYTEFVLDPSGTIEGIECANSSYALVEEDGFVHIAEATVSEEVTLKGANAIVNAEVNGTYYPLAFKLTLSAPASFQSSEYSYDVGYTYIKKNGQSATAHNGNVSFTDDEAYLVIGMNPALMTNDITWKVVKDGESVFSGAVNPLDCLKSYIKDDNESTQTIAKDLIVMGVYTEEYLYNTSTLRSEVISQNLISEDDLDLSGVTLQSTGYTKDWNSSEDNLLKYYGCSLIFNEYGLAMRQYVYYGEGQGLSDMDDAIACTVNGVDYRSILNFVKYASTGTFYYAPVSNIKLSDLDKPNTFVFKYRKGQGTEFIDSGSIEYSVVDYMNMARNSKSTNTKLMNTLLSMYSLYNSCKAATQA